MVSDLESKASSAAKALSTAPAPYRQVRGWLKVGSIAAASAVVGGLAAAWFYRNTLSRLREAQHEVHDAQTPVIGDESEEDF